MFVGCCNETLPYVAVDFARHRSTAKPVLDMMQTLLLSWSGSWAWLGIGEGIFERLEAREPKNLSNLGYMLNIVYGVGINSMALLGWRSCEARIAVCTCCPLVCSLDRG